MADTGATLHAPVSRNSGEVLELGSEDGLQGSGARGGAAAVPLEDRGWWRAVHALSYLLGGLLFVVGTWIYYPAMAPGANTSALGNDIAWLYTIGSCVFL
eukprot:SAG22_NODE_13656_length_399_cov_0.693333_1_plen_99_part_10